MTDPTLPPDREAEIRAHTSDPAVGGDLVAAAGFIRASLLASVPEAHRRDFAALLDTAAAAPRSSTPRVRAAMVAVAALVAAGSLAAGMAGALPVPLQDALHRGGAMVGIHVPDSDHTGDVDIVDTPVDRPLWDDGHHPDAPSDGHSHIS